MRSSTFLLITLCVFLYSCDEGGLLIETDISDSEVTILSPTEGSQISSSVVNFNWEAIEDASRYEVQVANPDFENSSQLLLNQEDSLTSVSLELNIGVYEWRVRALNSNSVTTYSSAKFSVVPIENFSDNTVLLTSPIDNLITNSPSQDLQWEKVDGANLYRIQVLEDGSIVQEQQTSNTTYTITLSEGDLVWQVRAENGTENTLYSSRSILVDITSPNTPTLSLPEDNATLTDETVSFEWSREVIEGSIENDSIFIYRDKQFTDLVINEEASSPFSQLLEEGMYYWFVKGFDEAGNLGTESSVFSFTIDTP